jgi:hypothetical protein
MPIAKCLYKSFLL